MKSLFTIISVTTISILFFFINTKTQDQIKPKLPKESTLSKETENKTWPTGKTFELDGLKITLSAPVAIERRSELFWYPNLVHFADGVIAIIIRTGDDELVVDSSMIAWSKDGGLNWSEPQELVGQSFGYMTLPNGDVALVPFHFFSTADGFKAPMTILTSKGAITRKEMSITGLPRPEGGMDIGNAKADVAAAKKLGRATFVTDGQVLQDKDGVYLMTLYGLFRGTSRYSLLVAESKNGFQWSIRSIIADETCKLPGKEGPCEADLCRLPDGRLMCVFRDGSPLFGQTWSSDEGKTWTEPVAMKVGKVEPRMLVLKAGVIVLTCGRPGLYLAFNRDLVGKDWQTVDTLVHHNTLLPQEPISTAKLQAAGGTSSYCGVVSIDANTFLYCYDRMPESFRARTGWKANPKDADNIREKFNIYMVRVKVELK